MIDFRIYLTSWRRIPGTRKFRSKEWIQRLKELIVLPYLNRSIPWILLPGVLLVLEHPLKRLRYVPKLNKVTLVPLNSTKKDVNCP